MPVTWLCPACGRRVPQGLGECRCGTRRPAPGALEAARRRERLPRDVIALLVVFVLVVIAGLVALLLPYRRIEGPALLGTIDPSPRAMATRTPLRPAASGRR